jgi:RNA polymerase-binding transcription factor
MRRDEWDEADARGEVAPRVARSPDGGWLVEPQPTAPAGLRERLERRAGQLAEELAALERQDHPAEGARPQYGKRIGDHTSDALETRRNVAAADTLRRQQAEVARALAKLAEGSYGRCDGCGRPIGTERLEALPWAAECLSCRGGDRRRGQRA